MAEGRFTISTRIYLTTNERAKLLHMLENAERELDEWLTELVVAQIELLPEPPPATNASGERPEAELHKRRAELRKLRSRLNDPHNPPPPWLVQMVTDLEAEVRRLEGASGKG